MNIPWKKIELEDRDVITSYYTKDPLPSCEGTFANNYLWAPHYPITFAIIHDMLVFCVEEESVSVSFPRGEEVHLKETMEILFQFFKELNQPIQINMVTKSQFERLEALYPDRFQIEHDRDAADYIYESEKLISLAGKKLHAKRNHINKFKAEHPEWTYESIAEENKADCFAMLDEWRHLNECDKDPAKSRELCVTKNAIEHLEDLGLVGGLIRVDGQVVAFSLGEACTDDVFVVHIEKAFGTMQGAYAMINQQFITHEGASFTYVNREEDTGAEGLRKAKLSYYPAYLHEKGIVTFL